MSGQPSGGQGHDAAMPAGPRTYLLVAVFLVAITIMEVGSSICRPWPASWSPVLLILSTLQFVLVACSTCT